MKLVKVIKLGSPLGLEAGVSFDGADEWRIGAFKEL
jgi:hypothetical protein